MKIAHIEFAMILLLFCGCGSDVSNNTEITGLEKIGKINVLYVRIAETMDLSSKSGRTWQMWLVRGGAFYQIDLERVKMNDVGNKIEISIDEPSIYPVANMKRTKPFASGTAIGITDKTYNEMTRRASTEANKTVAKAARSKEYMDMAKDQAHEVLKQMLGKEVALKWQNKP